MACYVILETKVKEGCEEKFRQFLVSSMPGTRAYPGCNSMTVLQKEDDPSSFVIYELWDTKEQYLAYYSWRVEAGIQDETAKIVESSKAPQFFANFGI